MRRFRQCLTLALFAAALLQGCAAYSAGKQSPSEQGAGDPDALMARGSARFNAGDAGAALLDFQAAAGAASTSANLKRGSALLYMQGRALHELGRNTEAIEAYRQAAAAQRRSAELMALGYTLHAWGDALTALGDPYAAQSTYEDALLARRHAHDMAGEARTLVNLAQSQATTGQWGTAIVHLQEVQGLLSQVDLPRQDVARFANSTGLLQALVGQLDSAQLSFTQARQIYAELGDGIGQSESLRNAAYLKVQQGDCEAARVLYTEAQRLLPAERVVERASALNGLGYCLVRLGRGGEAIEPLTAAVAELRSAGRSLELSRALESLGSAHAEVQDARVAIRGYAESLHIAREQHSAEDEREVLFSLGRLAAGQGYPNTAIVYLQAAVNVSQSLRTSAASLAVGNRRTLTTRLSEPYKLLARLLIESNRVAEGEQVLMALKEQEFSGYVRGSEVPLSPVQALNDGQRSAEQEEFSALNDLGDRLADLGAQIRAREAGGALPQDSTLSSLKEKESSVEDDMQALLGQIDVRLKNPASRALEVKVSDSQWRELTQRISEHPLGESTVVIMFAAEEHKTTLLIVGPAGSRSRALPVGNDTLDRLVTQLRTTIESKEDYVPAARELHQLLIAPVERLLAENGWEAGTWMLFLTDRLRYLPVAALIGPDGRHVIESHRLAILTTPALVRMQDDPRSDWTVTAFASTHAYPEYRVGPLPSARIELDGIVRANNAASGIIPGQMLVDDDFTRAAWLRMFQPEARAASGPSVIHVASHFISQQADWSHSFLLLGGGAQFLMSELNSGSLLLSHIDLVTLSACETEVNDQAVGGELEGLGVLLQKRGAHAVIGTLWAVADASTSTLMQAFYRARGARRLMSKSAALQTAQLELLHASDPRLRHPYFWAPFVLMGNWL